MLCDCPEHRSSGKFTPKDGQLQYLTGATFEDLVACATLLADVAASARAQSGGLYCVGFAAETQYLQAQAQAKRTRKGVPLMVGNLGPATFGQDDNALLVIDEVGVTEWPRASKLSLARQLVADIAVRISAKETP